MKKMRYLVIVLCVFTFLLSESVKTESIKDKLTNFISKITEMIEKKKESVKKNVTEESNEELVELVEQGYETLKQTTTTHRLNGIRADKYFDFINSFFKKFSIDDYYFNSIKIGLIQLMFSKKDDHISYNFGIFDKETKTSMFCNIIAQYDSTANKFNWLYSSISHSGNKVSSYVFKKTNVDERGNVSEKIEILKKDEEITEKDMMTMYSFYEITSLEKIREEFMNSSTMKFLQ